MGDFKEGKKLRILIADDHQVIREGVRRLIERKTNWEICGEAADGRQAVRLATTLKPDVVVLDLGMPELNGVEAARQIKRALPHTEVLIFTGDENEELIEEVLHAGALSYVVKSDISDQLIAAIDALGANRPYFTGRVSEIMLATYLNAPRDPAKEHGSMLTAREREVVQLLADGKSNKEVAATLGISTKTVETHRAAIMRKLHFKSFAELVRYAFRNKMVTV